ncbi:unnamed protein product, partial [Laminaria digitata]
ALPARPVPRCCLQKISVLPNSGCGIGGAPIEPGYVGASRFIVNAIFSTFFSHFLRSMLNCCTNELWKPGSHHYPPMYRMKISYLLSYHLQISPQSPRPLRRCPPDPCLLVHDVVR